MKPTLSELLRSFSLPQQSFTEACVPTLTSLLDLASTSAFLQLPRVATAACTAVGVSLLPASLQHSGLELALPRAVRPQAAVSLGSEEGG